MTWTLRPADWDKPGHIDRSDEKEAILDQIASLTASGWTSYTPAWTSTLTQPVLNNGTLVGRYRQASGSDMVHWVLGLSVGNTTTFGTGVYRFTYPTSPAPSATSLTLLTAFGYIYDSSSGATYSVAAKPDAAGTVLIGTGAGNVGTNTQPITWATSDLLILNGFYEPA